MHITLRHHPSFSVVTIEGAVTGSDMEGVLDLFSLVPIEQSLIADLTKVDSLDWRGARVLSADLVARSRVAHVAVIVEDDDVAAALVRENLHHSVAFVRNHDDAVSLVTGIVLVGR